MWKEAFSPISLSFLRWGPLLPERHLQVRNLTSTRLSGCGRGCSGYTIPPWCALGDAQEPVGGLGSRAPWGPHRRGCETTNWPHFSSLTATPTVSPGPVQRPAPCLCSHSGPCRSSTHSKQNAFLKCHPAGVISLLLYPSVASRCAQNKL